MLLRSTEFTRLWAPSRLLQACGALTSKGRTGHAVARSAMSLAKVDGAAYGQQLSAKADRLRSRFADFSLPELETFDSQTENYRMRCERLNVILYHPRCCSPVVYELATASIFAGQSSASGMKVLMCSTSCLRR